MKMKLCKQTLIIYSNQGSPLKQQLKQQETHSVYLRDTVNGFSQWFWQPAGWLPNTDTKAWRRGSFRKCGCQRNPKGEVLFWSKLKLLSWNKQMPVDTCCPDPYHLWCLRLGPGGRELWAPAQREGQRDQALVPGATRHWARSSWPSSAHRWGNRGWRSPPLRSTQSILGSGTELCLLTRTVLFYP